MVEKRDDQEARGTERDPAKAQQPGGQQQSFGQDQQDNPPDNFASQSAGSQQPDRPHGSDGGASASGGPSSDGFIGSKAGGSDPQVKSVGTSAGQPTPNPASGSNFSQSQDPKIHPDSTQANTDDSGSGGGGGGDS